MPVNFSFQVVEESGTVRNYLYCENFRLVKDVYTPYTELSVAYYPTSKSIGKPNRVRVILNGTIIHEGPVDKIHLETNSQHKKFTIRSRGFTSLLLQNEITPGLHNNLTFNSLMDLVNIPNISHENNSTGTNYIYVKQGSSMWEALANFCYKVYGTYPYISGANTVCVSPKANPTTFTRATADCLSCGQDFDFTNAISHFHMADIDNNYGQYNYTDSTVTTKLITRHKHYSLDEQYLENPSAGLLYRSKMSKRRIQGTFCSYPGYDGEDLGDKITLSGDISIAAKRITRIEIIGKKTSTGDYYFTKNYAHIDGFYT